MPSIDVKNAKQLGAVIKAARQARGISTTDLADRLDVSRQYLSRIENAAPNLLAKRLFWILNSLKIKVTLTYEPKADTDAHAADSAADDQIPG